ncbi:MAG: Ig-like domain-containing protein [Bacteroidales bacterium]|nr:Ig-like domain-containing protein [Bacteroidales bacterium]
MNRLFFICLFLPILFVSCKKEENNGNDKLELLSCFVGPTQLVPAAETPGIPLNQDILLNFSSAVDTSRAVRFIILKDQTGSAFPGIKYIFSNEGKTVILRHNQLLAKSTHYIVSVSSSLKGENGESFTGAEFTFATASGVFTLNKILLNQKNFMPPAKFYEIPRQGVTIEMDFSDALDTTQIKNKFSLAGSNLFDVTLSNDNKTVHLICPTELLGYKKYDFSVSSNLKSVSGYSFGGFNNWFMTTLDSSLKFPLISDDELLTLVQKQSFKFFYNYAHPVSGMSRERLGSGDIVTSGGSGFGVMALIVGIERGFITRTDGMAQLSKMINFLETCDRFHGAWSHWINGSNGNVVPFGQKDNGGDLVETAYMAQGLLTMRQYLNPSDPFENDMIFRINQLYNGIEWDWYTRGGQNVLYWHWSPNYGWDMNFRIQGYNETLITYVMAAASTTHTIPASAYHSGYARNGAIRNGKTFYNYVLPVGYDYGGPLFFAHYSFLGLDPRNLSDSYANYWTQNVNHSLINWAYCADNPNNYPGYSDHSWGLTASDIPGGYAANEPTNDRGVISPTAAVSSLPYSPEQSMDAIRHFYFILGDKLWGEYGFYDAFDVHQGWWASSYIAIDQGPQVCMIENYRTGLLWDLFMSCPEVQTGLTKLGFNY